MDKTAKGHQLVDLLDMDRLQELQDNLARALDLAFITVDYRGAPVIEYSGFTDYCNAMRKSEERCGLCYQCDAHGGLHATITGEPYIFRCHGGLVDFAVPLIVEGKYMGAVMGGQCELLGDAPPLAPILPQRTDWEADPELSEARSRVHRMDYGKLVASIYLVRDMIQNMLEEEYRRVTEEELKRTSKELMEEKAARVSLEMAMEGSRHSLFQEYVGEEFVFHVLNVISHLAFREKAEETERAVCDFAAMLRYILENGDYNFVTVGEELEYIDYYLQIQKRRLEGLLSYELAVPEKYHGVLCPFMLLQPLVENSLKYAVETSREGGTLTIRGGEEGRLLVLSICDSGAGMTRRQISMLLELEGKRRSGRDKQSLTRINQSLKDVFGPECGVTIRSREDGVPGTEVQIRLPLSSGLSVK